MKVVDRMDYRIRIKKKNGGKRIIRKSKNIQASYAC